MINSSVFLKKNDLKTNTIILITQGVISTLISLLTVRELIILLGLDNYGTFVVFNSFTLFFSLFTAGATISIQKFVAGSLNGKNTKTVIINSLILISVLSIIIFMIAYISMGQTFNLLFHNHNINYLQYKLILLIFILQFILRLIFLPFEAYLFSNQTILIIVLLNILESIIKYFTIILIIPMYTNSLLSYSLALVIITFLVSVPKLLIVKSQINLKFNNFITYYSPGLIKKMAKFSTYTYLSVLGGGINNYGPILIITHFFSPIANAAQGIANQVSTQSTIFSNHFLKNANPKILSTDNTNPIRYSNIAFYLSFPLILFLLLESRALLNIWLKTYPDLSIDILNVILITSLVNVIMSPYITMLRKHEKIKKLEIISLFFQITPIFISLYLFEIGFISIIYIYQIILTFNFIRLLLVIYLNVKQNFISLEVFIKNSLKNILIPLLIFNTCIISLNQLFKLVFKEELLIAVFTFVSIFILIIIFYKKLIK